MHNQVQRPSLVLSRCTAAGTRTSWVIGYRYPLPTCYRDVVARFRKSIDENEDHPVSPQKF